MENISKHISYAEATKCQTAVRYGKDNTPNTQQLQAMKMVAQNVFEPIREHFKKPIAVVSFFRSKSVNVLTGGTTPSGHSTGCAMDVDADVHGGMSNADIFHFIRKNLDFDKLIWSFGNDNQPDWVHVSYRETGNRKEVLKAVKNGYQTLYKTY